MSRLTFFAFSSLLCVRNVGAIAYQGADHAQLVSEIATQIGRQFPQQPRALLQGLAKKALAMAAESEHIEDEVSSGKVDLSELCPSGWADLGDASSCLAPAFANGGSCGDVVEFGSLTPSEKLRLADTCGATYRTRGACTESFEEPCPIGWHLDNEQQCVAPADYTGPCAPHAHLGSLSSVSKFEYGRACEVRWPCRQTLQSILQAGPGLSNDDCVANFASVCPDGWTWHPEAGACRAPTTYEGPCSVSMFPQGYNDRMKQALSSVCMVRWPCSASPGRF